MRAATLIIQGLAWMMITMLFIPPELHAENFEQTEQEDRFRKEELDQMLAPIALYPDSLISQILMASTYPLEIVQAQRWVKQNKTLTGDALDNSLRKKSWDPSVKSLCHFPDVLFAMSDNLDQTSKLGDAFLSQNDDVMVTIQRLRRKAEVQGNLMTTKEQQVIHEEDTIRIEPAVRQVVYVPVYDPLYVYGPWWYPAYPPHYWHHTPSVIRTRGLITFRPHFFIGINLFSWSWVDWHRHHIYIDVRKAKRFHRFRQRHNSRRYFWRHNPAHRRGVAYRSKKIRKRFGQKLPRRIANGDKMRGYAVKHHKRKAMVPSKNFHNRRKPVDMSQIIIESKRPQRNQNHWKKATPGNKIHGYPSRHHKRKALEPSKNYRKRRKAMDMPRIKNQRKRIQRNQNLRAMTGVPQKRTRREGIQRTDKHQDRAGVVRVRPERKNPQIPKRWNSPSKGLSKGKFERNADKRGFQIRQRGDKRYRGGTVKYQGRGFRRRSGT